MSPADLPLAAKLGFLQQPGSYGDGPAPVQAIETHLSWVFLVGPYAWKLKKPVVQGVFDARSLAARCWYCEEEVRLNRRLAPDIYLAARPLVLDHDGHLRIGMAPDAGGEVSGKSSSKSSSSNIVDWLVQMRRLPTEAMLDSALQAGRATAQHMQRIAQLLAAFHLRSERIRLEPGLARTRLDAAVEENAVALCTPAFALPAALTADLCARQRAALRDVQELLDQRVQSGRVVDGHGDVRAEHVYLGEPPAIIDCIEFSASLRIVDGMDEAGFLALECERLGSAELGEVFLRCYQAAARDTPPTALRHLYQSLRATVRARLTILHLQEERFRYSSLWRARTLTYLQLAQQHLAAASG